MGSVISSVIVASGGGRHERLCYHCIPLAELAPRGVDEARPLRGFRVNRGAVTVDSGARLKEGLV